MSLVGVWSMYEARGEGSWEDEVYVFANGGLGACVYFNDVAQDLELFRWKVEDDRLTFEPLRRVWIGRGSGSPQERRAGPSETVRYTLGIERDPWNRDACILRLLPTRGMAAQYAKSRLSELHRLALQRYLSLELGPELAMPLRTQTW